MGTLRRVWNRLRARVRRRRPLHVWHHPEYRPLTVDAQSEFDPRRADRVLWYLREHSGLAGSAYHTPPRIPWRDLLRVHSGRLLESLDDPEVLGRVFALEPDQVRVEASLDAVRRACGGTLAAARLSLQTQTPGLNLLGGFHHAGYERAGGYCVINDVAVAAAALRADGLAGTIAILDLDAHPPDGTADCLLGARAGAAGPVWIGSLSGVDWGPLPGVDETVLPAGCEDAAYLLALDALLLRLPEAPITFVLAGGDVLSGDTHGGMALTLEGLLRRDQRVADALRGRASVWLPAGGYRRDAWRAVAGTALALLGRSRPAPAAPDPLSEWFAHVADEVDPAALGDDPFLTADDVAEALGMPTAHRRFLGFYTRHGIEYALEQYGLLELIRRLGYRGLRVQLDHAGDGDRARVLGTAHGVEQVLIETILEIRNLDDRRCLFIHWLNLRDPGRRFGERPPLPGQDAPGLGLAREVAELFVRIAHRLHLDGVAFTPSWFHVAYAGRDALRFLDARHQGQFEALIHDLGGATPLLELTRAVADGRVLVNGRPWAWSASPMGSWLGDHDPDWATAVVRARESSHFTLDGRQEPPRPGAGTTA